MFARILKKYNPGQIRDRSGKWARTRGVAGDHAAIHNVRNYNVDQVVSKALGDDPATKERYAKAIEEINTDYKAGLSTHRTHSKNGDGTGGYTQERIDLHNKIIDHVIGNIAKFKPKAGRPPELILLGGRGGSGKSNFDKANNVGKKGAQNFGVYSSKTHAVIDPDAIKEMLPEYDPAKAFLVHHESSHIVDRILAGVKKSKINAVLDVTMRTSVVPIADRFKKAGFRTEAHYMHKAPEGALTGAVARWNRETLVYNPITKEAKKFPHGRLVPPAVIENNIHNEHNFDLLTKHVDNWSVTTNESKHGFSGKKLAQSIKKILGFSEILHPYVPVPDNLALQIARVLKYNPYHGKDGRFTSGGTGGGATYVSIGGKFKSSNAKDKAAFQKSTLDVPAHYVRVGLPEGLYDSYHKPATPAEKTTQAAAVKAKKPSQVKFDKAIQKEVVPAYEDLQNKLETLGIMHPKTIKAQNKLHDAVNKANGYAKTLDQTAQALNGVAEAHKKKVADAEALSKVSMEHNFQPFSNKLIALSQITALKKQALVMEDIHGKDSVQYKKAMLELDKSLDHALNVGANGSKIKEYVDKGIKNHLDSKTTVVNSPKLIKFVGHPDNSFNAVKELRSLAEQFHISTKDKGFDHPETKAAMTEMFKAKAGLKADHKYSDKTITDIINSVHEKVYGPNVANAAGVGASTFQKFKGYEDAKAASLEFQQLVHQFHDLEVKHGPQSPETKKAWDALLASKQALITQHGFETSKTTELSTEAYHNYVGGKPVLTGDGQHESAASAAAAADQAKVAAGGPPQYKKSDNLTGALAVYNQLGAHYYQLKQGANKDSPELQAAHVEWEKSKTELKNSHDYSTEKLSMMAVNLKTNVGSDMLGKITEHKTKIVDAIVAAGGNTASKKLDAIYAEAKAAGLTQVQINSAMAEGSTQHTVNQMKAKTAVGNTIKSAASEMYQAIKEKGPKSQEAITASEFLDAMAVMHKDTISAAEFQSLKGEGEAHANAVANQAVIIKKTPGAIINHDKLKFHNVNVYETAQAKSFRTHQNQMRASLSDTGMGAIKNYTGTGYKKTNRAIGAHGQALFAGEKSVLTPNQKAYGKKLDDALNSSTLGVNVQLVRSMRIDWLENQLGVNLSTAAPSDLIGKTYVEHAYSSTSIKDDFSGYQNGSKILLKIRAPGDAKGMFVDPVSSNKGEMEVVLPRGATYIIRGYEAANDVLHVDLVGFNPQPL